jgi:hypothetical protein
MNKEKSFVLLRLPGHSPKGPNGDWTNLLPRLSRKAKGGGVKPQDSFFMNTTPTFFQQSQEMSYM